MTEYVIVKVALVKMLKRIMGSELSPGKRLSFASKALRDNLRSWIPKPIIPTDPIMGGNSVRHELRGYMTSPIRPFRKAVFKKKK